THRTRDGRREGQPEARRESSAFAKAGRAAVMLLARSRPGMGRHLCRYRGGRVASIASIGGVRGGATQSRRRAIGRADERMGGEIVLDSDPGKDSVVAFTARFLRQAGATAPAGVTPPAHLRGARALIVDKDVASRGMLDRWVRSWNMEPTA